MKGRRCRKGRSGKQDAAVAFSRPSLLKHEGGLAVSLPVYSKAFKWLRKVIGVSLPAGVSKVSTGRRSSLGSAAAENLFLPW